MKIDSHQHFWNYDPVEHSWINDEMSILKRDYLPADLQKELQGNGLDGSVAVQASQSEDETTFLLDLADKNDLIKGVVGWVDLRAENIQDRLEYFADDNPVLKGFRHVVQDEPDRNFMLGKEFLKGISFLEQFNFTYDILIFPIQLEATKKLVKRFPNQTFVIDHIAKPYIAKGDIDGWKEHMMELGKCDNLCCKLSGMVTEADLNNWTYEDFVPYLDVVVESFGVEKLMFGSDWPVCLLGGSYGQVKGIVDQYFDQFSESERTLIQGGNAIEFYGL